MKNEYNFLLTQTIIFACVIGIYRWNKLDKSYRPFLYLCILDWFAELLAFIFIQNRILPYGVSNSYLLFCCLLIIWQFRIWGFFNNKPWLFDLAIYSQITIWVLDHLIINKLNDITSIFRIEYSFLTVIMSITYINKLIIGVYGNILKNAKFLICAGFIIFYTFNIFVEVFYYSSGSSLIFKQSVFDIKRYVNVFINLIFALAMVWIPKKKNFITPY